MVVEGWSVEEVFCLIYEKHERLKIIPVSFYPNLVLSLWNEQTGYRAE